MHPKHILQTGLSKCYNEDGQVIECRGTGQDAALLSADRVGGWTAERFTLIGEFLVQDQATDLIWTRDSCPTEYPLGWQEGLEFIERMNDEISNGRGDWRMPNRRELRSLIDHSARKPALTPGHPFHNVFLGWYWTSTTAAIATRYAWYVHLEGGRMFYGNKDGFYWLWPVCGNSNILPYTGATHCYDEGGSIISCAMSRQDGALRMGAAWPANRFFADEEGVLDVLTGLTWHLTAQLGAKNMSWKEALAVVADYARQTKMPWRMPTINELESLVDAAHHSPALTEHHPCIDVESGYWSSTTSAFATDWAYVLYMMKGAVGVGFKKNSDFALWPVMTKDVSLMNNCRRD